MIRISSPPVLLAVLLLGAQALPAQAPPSPAEFLGYEAGARYTTHARVVRYVERLAAESERVELVSYGASNEGRELLLVVVGSESNMARLEELRAGMAKLADPRLLGEGEDAEDLIASLPAFVWLSYCVHGNETSCTEAALEVLHRLAAAEDEETLRLLEQTVVIVDPCVNPDGRDRYVNWFNSVRGRRGDPHPQSLEHREPWPGGRYNHYGFDLNRDWAFASQVETRSRLVQFLRWNPQVHGDFHEMGQESSYFFFPADLPVNANIPPSTTRWGEVFGRGNAGAFDARGWQYYTAESFDLFYPGYGDSWPSLQGAIGMTFEQAGHGRSGIVVRRRDGDLLTLAERIEHHVVASMATIATAADNREALLRDYHGFRRSAIEEGRGGAVREFVLVPGRDHERSGRLVDLLLLQGIEVRRATSDFEARDVVDYFGRRRTRSFPAGSYLVSLAQPTKRLAKTLLEPRTEIRELYFYDVAAWSLPYTFGVEAWWSPLAIEAPSELLEAAPRTQGAVAEGPATYGYLLRWDTLAGVRAALRLQDRGVVVRSAREAFTLAGEEWPRGTVFVPRGGNAETLDEVVARVAADTGAEFRPARTGMTEKGIDLGSDKVVRMKPVRVALLGGEGTSVTSFGATRFLLEDLYDVPHSVFLLEDLPRLDLEDYTALVLPSSFGRLEDAAVEKLRDFAREGGVVIAWGAGARGLGAEGSKLVQVSTKTPEKKEAASEKPERPRKIEELEEEERLRSAPGAIFSVELDPAHPLSFGYGEEIAVFKEGTMTFDPLAGGTPVGLFREAPPLSGYVLEETEKDMRGRGYLMVERLGRGSVVLFAEDPNFRSAWHGLTRLFLNAVMLLPRD